MKKRFYIKFLFFTLFLQHCSYLSAQNNHVIDSIRTLIKKAPDDTSKVSKLINLSLQYKNNNTDSALKYGKQAFDLSQQLNSLSKIGYSHIFLGSLFLDKGDYGTASYHFLKALKIHENLKDSASIARCYHNIGIIYYYQKNYIEAMNYYNKALNINKKLKNKDEMSKNYIHIGIIYNKEKKYEDAITYYQKALVILEETGNKKFMSEIYSNMCVTYYYMGKLNHAVECSKKSVKFAEELQNKRVLPNAYCNLAQLLIEIKKYDEANFALQNALIYSKETNNKNSLQNSYQCLASLYEEQKEFQKSFEYGQLADAITDSIYYESNSRQANKLTATYESEKKELMIKNLEKDKALSQEKLAREKNFKIYLLLFSILILAFAFVFLKNYLEKKKTNFALSSAFEEIEEKNKDITASIHYSKRIQDASLPPKELQNKLFPEAFVFFKPKDIVSGDFYWYTEKNGKKIIAACDCTGHGVPGALMSMIGMNILNQIVNEKGITAPDEILNQLHHEVRKALKQEGQGKTQDGMDIALITFNSETEIEYAGAQRPLWIVRSQALIHSPVIKEEDSDKRNNAPTVFIEEIKAEKFSIGGNQSETERKFNKHKISLSKGDCVYIFSDGFADQFGGIEEKRFMSKRFKDLLLANYKMPMPAQENILIETIETWKGIHEQVDDILVIGVRV